MASFEFPKDFPESYFEVRDKVFEDVTFGGDYMNQTIFFNLHLGQESLCKHSHQ